MLTRFSLGLSTFLVSMITSVGLANPLPEDIDTIEVLGAHLFFDVNLSKNRSQSCATCHDPAFGFADPRNNGHDDADRATSLGDDGQSIGDRNAPTASYAALSPAFHKNKKGNYVGGQFWDGRERSLAGQAGGPPLNPVEMGMPNKASVVKRLQENKAYIAAFKRFFGDSVFHDTDKAYAAMTKSIEAFEKTDFFSPFDSKYDRYLRGEYKMTKMEELGRTLFFSPQFTNCNICHQLRTTPGAAREPFTNFEYHNIGVPANLAMRTARGDKPGTVDKGLLANPHVSDPKQAGKFKTPTLRNVAVTGPYMHNGLFKDLRTVVLFYNRYNSRAPAAQINPETGKPWGSPEVRGTLAVKELTTGPALKSRRVDALVAFMKTLTDKRYEHLLEKQDD